MSNGLTDFEILEVVVGARQIGQPTIARLLLPTELSLPDCEIGALKLDHLAPVLVESLVVPGDHATPFRRGRLPLGKRSGNSSQGIARIHGLMVNKFVDTQKRATQTLGADLHGQAENHIEYQLRVDNDVWVTECPGILPVEIQGVEGQCEMRN